MCQQLHFSKKKVELYFRETLILEFNSLTSGRSFMEYTITPWYCGVFSVILPNPDFKIWFPYRNDCSPDGLTQILYWEVKKTISLFTGILLAKPRITDWVFVSNSFEKFHCEYFFDKPPKQFCIIRWLESTYSGSDPW